MARVRYLQRMIRTRLFAKPYERWTSAQKKYVKAELKLRDGTQCHWCKVYLNDDASVKNDRYCTIDHLVRRADGGTDELENMVLACRTCNSNRHNKPDHPWYQNHKKVHPDSDLGLTFLL